MKMFSDPLEDQKLGYADILTSPVSTNFETGPRIKDFSTFQQSVLETPDEIR